MFKQNKNNLEKVLTPILGKVVRERIRRFKRYVQEDAWIVAYIAYRENNNVLETLTKWNRAERVRQKKELSIYSSRPRRRDKAEIMQISKDYK